MAKIKILIVDDHAIMRDGIRALLSADKDIEVVGDASDGKEAVAKAQELSPDVIVMDIAMPVMDGLEATRRIKKKNPKIKVLVLTQYNNREYILSAIKAGASGYLPKRAMGSELVSAIRAVHTENSFLYPSAATALIKDYLDKITEEPYDRLTDREREVLKLIAESSTSQDIANMLGINLKTVLVHRSKIMKKLGVHNRTDLIKYAMRKGIVEMES
jgi:DNA-binding NarL/FixJ family response regulator